VGLGNQWILAVYSAVITSRFPENRQRMFLWVGAVFAAAAAVGPYVLGYSLDITPNWRWVFLSFGVFVWIWLAALLGIAGKRMGTITRPKQADSVSLKDKKNLVEKLRELRGFLVSGLFNRYALWLLGLLVILDNLATITIVTWTPRFFQLNYGLQTAPSSLFLSTLAIGVFLGRLFLAAFVAGKWSDRKLLGYCYAGAMLAYACILLEPGYVASVLLMGVVGAFASAQAPTVYSLASAKFRERAATAIPLTDAIGSAGGLMGPTLIGFLADRAGSLHKVLWLSIPAGGLLVTIALIWEWLDTEKPVAAGPQSHSA
jgi:MFS family permease